MSDILPTEALESMPPPAALRFTVDKEALAATIRPKVPVGTPDPITGQPKRRPGRPVGSTTKRAAPTNVNPSQRMVGSRPPKATEPVDEVEAKKAEKKERAEQYASYINKELNDKLFMLISGIPNSPFTISMFYKDNRVPPSVAPNPDFSELGNTIAIPADVASSWGKVLAELSYTDIGKTVGKATDNPLLGIATAIIAAIYSTYRYSQQLKPLLDQIRAIKQAQQETNNGTNTEGN